AELALAVTAVAVGVDPGMQELFLGHTHPAVTRAVVPLGLLQDLTALLPGMDGTLHPRHDSGSQQPADGPTLRLDLGHALHPPTAAPRLLRQHVVAGGLAVEDLSRPGNPEPLGRTSVRLHLRHVLSLFRRGRGRFCLHRLGLRFPRPGLLRPGRRDLLFGRRDHHHHVPAILLWHRFDHGQTFEVLPQPVQDPTAKLGVGHLATPEHDGHLYPGARPQEPLEVTLLGRVVVRIDLGPELDLLDLDPGLFLAGFLHPDVPLVLVLAVVHDPCPRGASLWRHLDQIEVLILGLTERLLGRDDPDLRPIRSHQADLWRPDPVVYARIGRDPASPPTETKAPTGRRCLAGAR